MQVSRLLFNFDGRLALSQYWGCNVVLVLPALVLYGILSFVALGKIELETNSPKGALVELVVILLLLYPCSAVGVKRLHDLNLSGWWFVLIAALAFASLIATAAGLVGTPDAPNLISRIFQWGGNLLYIVLGLVHGTEGFNQYGPDPRWKQI